MQSLQQQLESKTEEYNRLMHFFITLQSGTDNQATTLLARLRLGESIDDLIGPVGSAQSSSPGYVLFPSRANVDIVLAPMYLSKADH